MSSIATVLEHLKTQRVDYSIAFLSNPDVRIEVRGDTAVGEKKPRRKIVIDDDEEEEDVQIASSIGAFDDDEEEQIASSFRGEKKKKKKKNKSPEQVLRSQCSMRKEDVRELIVEGVDVVSSLRLFKDITYARAKREGFTFSKNHRYDAGRRYLNDNMMQVLDESHLKHPNVFHQCVTTGDTARPHSLRRI